VAACADATSNAVVFNMGLRPKEVVNHIWRCRK